MTSFLPSPTARVWGALILLAALLFIGRAKLLGETGNQLLRDMQNAGPNAVGIDLITQNYYEELLKEDREAEWRGLGVFRLFMTKKINPDFEERSRAEGTGSERILVHEDGLLPHSLKPYVSEMNKGVMITTNRWGHRDTDDYDITPEPGVFRIALVGSSNSLGYGVEMHEGFEQRLEMKLNDVLPALGGYRRYEIINFAVHQYQLIERTYVVRHLAPAFNPHMILVEGTMLDMRRTLYEALAKRVSNGCDVELEFVRDIVRRSHADSKSNRLKVEQRLQQYSAELMAGCYADMALVQRETGIPIVPIMLRLEVDTTHRNLHHMAAVAEGAGLNVLRIFDAYEGRTAKEMYLTDRDYHPSAFAHGLLAEDIFDKMMASPAVRSLLLGPPASPVE